MVRLRDGRTLGFVEYGSADGLALVNCHGGLVCRLDIATADHAARAMGIRIISPDRPGVAVSDRKQGRRMLDWADDVTELADHLGLDSFATIGWSMGGQYALALAHAMPSRVSQAIVVAGCAPLDDAEHFDALTKMDKRLTNLSRRSSPLARGVFATMRTIAHRAPRRFLASSAREMGLADAAVIQRPDTRYTALIREGLRNTTGAVDEYVAWAEPWGFVPREVTTPVHIWWGDADQLVARDLVTPLASELPHATFTVVRDAGHFVAFDRWPDVLPPIAG